MLGTAIYVLSLQQTTQPVELVILAVACVAYLFILISDPSQWLKLRYVDWFITVPLLVQAISPYNDTPFWLLATLATIMLLSGFLTVIKPTKQYWPQILLGFAAQIAFFVLLVTHWNTIPKWLIIFFVSWFFYGVVEILEGPQDNQFQTALDVFNKPVFIISLLANLS